MTNYPDIVYQAAEIVEEGLRRTGRSTQMIRQMKDGDVLVVGRSSMRQHYLDLARRVGIKIKVEVASKPSLHEVHEIARQNPFSNIFVSHVFQLDIIMETLHHQGKEIDELTKQRSTKAENELADIAAKEMIKAEQTAIQRAVERSKKIDWK